MNFIFLFFVIRYAIMLVYGQLLLDSLDFNQMFGWLCFNVGQELQNGLLQMVWDSSLRMIRRHAITILFRPGGDGSPTLVPPEV